MPANPVTHPSANVLQSFNLGKLDNEPAQKVVSHLEDCPACRQALAALPGDSFLDRLRDVRDRSGTNIPAKALARAAKGSPTDRPADSLPPAVVDLPPELANNTQYHVVRELGRGGMGVVYLARNVLLDRPEVLKVLNKALLDTPAAAERFLREIRSAAKLSHDNVVKAHSALALGELLVFAMEYVEGEDLAKVVKRQGPLPVPLACFYAHQVALGLQHAHEHGLVHRDIKPQNLILSRQEKKHLVKVLDFGLAKATREGKADTGLTGAGVVLGTPDYIAPEQAMDAASADIRADIYSLGCTLYFLLTGAPPFQGKSLMEVLQAHLLQEARPLNKVRDEVPAELAAVVAKMMAKEPAQRYQKPIEVAQALVPFVKTGAKPVPAGATEAVAEGPAKGARPGQPRPAETAAVWEGMVTEGGLIVAKARKQPTAQPAGKRGRAVAVALALALLVPLACWLAIVMLRVETPNGTLVVEMNDDEVEARIKNGKLILSGPDGKVRYILAASERSKKVEAGPYTIRVEGADGLVLDTPEFTLKKGGEVKVHVTIGQPSVVKNTPASLDPDRKAAEYVLSVGGLVRVNDEARDIKAVADLPKEAFRLTYVVLDNPKVDDRGLYAFKGCKNLTSLHLRDGSQIVGDAGLIHFKECKQLKNLWLYRTKVTDEGLASFAGCKGLVVLCVCDSARVGDAGMIYFKDCKDLTGLQLTGTYVTDVGLAHFKDCKHLEVLALDATQVTDNGLAYFKDCPLVGVSLSGIPKVSDVGLAHLNLKYTDFLNLSGTNVSNKSLALFKNCERVKEIRLQQTKVTAAGIDELKKALPKCRIDDWDRTGNK